MAADAWNDIKTVTLKTTWQKITEWFQTVNPIENQWNQMRD
jgi:hypothetical protein